ncbi:ferredoxin--NADP(+) reductase, partial [Enterococcus faecalis]
AIKGRELIANVEKQMQPYQHDVSLQEEVTHLAQEADELLRLDTTKGTHYSNTVIFAIGNGAIHLRLLAITNDDAFKG